LQRHEDDAMRGPVNDGPLEGLSQHTVPVGTDPAALPDWRRQFHPEPGAGPAMTFPPNLPQLRGDDFYSYGLPVTPYPSIGASGQLMVPTAGLVG
jgi:hypothetical protein